MVNNLRGWKIPTTIRNFILQSHRRAFQWWLNPMRIQGIGLYRHLQRDGCRVWMITEFYCFITAGFWIIITRLWFMRKTCHIAQPWDTGRGGSGAISCCDYLFSCLCQVFSSQCYLKSSVNRRNEEKFYIFPEKKKILHILGISLARISVSQTGRDELYAAFHQQGIWSAKPYPSSIAGFRNINTFYLPFPV